MWFPSRLPPASRKPKKFRVNPPRRRKTPVIKILGIHPERQNDTVFEIYEKEWIKLYDAHLQKSTVGLISLVLNCDNHFYNKSDNFYSKIVIIFIMGPELK